MTSKFTVFVLNLFSTSVLFIFEQFLKNWFFSRVNGRRMHNRATCPMPPASAILPRHSDFNGHMNSYHGISMPVPQHVSTLPGKDAHNRAYSQASAPEPKTEDYELAEYGYGKNHVKLLHVQRNGRVHTIREYEVDTHLKLDSKRDYLEGNNKGIIATDTQKNTVYILAKKHGVKSPEEFGMLLCSHFLYHYDHVNEVSVNVEEYPWERLEADDQPHNHAFVFSPSAFRFCTVTQKRHGKFQKCY